MTLDIIRAIEFMYITDVNLAKELGRNGPKKRLELRCFLETALFNGGGESIF